MSTRRRFFDVALGALAGAGVLSLAASLRHPEPIRADDAAPSNPQSKFLMTTGASVHGGVLLFLLDTETRGLLVYEAEGGSKGTRGITLVAARKVDQDVFVTGYNDKSEYSYSDLVKRARQEELRNKSLEDSAESPPSGAANPAKSDGDNH